MRKSLLAGAAIMAASGGVAFAQTSVPANPSQGQLAAPYGAGPAANNNNNAWGVANTPSGGAAAGPASTIYAPNVDAVPVPGTIVIRLNGRVEADVTANFTSADKGIGTGAGYKLNPVGVATYMRLYPGFDGLAANGLRYGATIELRENFGSGTYPGQLNGSSAATTTSATNLIAPSTIVSTSPYGAASGPSTNTSAETVFVRRAFVYLASDQAGILRLGQGDGVLSLFDNGIFTSQLVDPSGGPFNGSNVQSTSAQAGLGIPFVWLNQSGPEYSNNKIVYLTPQYYGFDFGVQYAPSEGNAFQDTGAGVGCTQAGPTCINVTSGSDPTRWYNQVGAGLRYQQIFGPVDFKTYGFYETAGKESNTAGTLATTFATRTTANIRYDNLSFYKAGIAVTAYNITAAVDYIGGAINGQLNERPTGGAPTNAVVAGLTYSNGPVRFGPQFAIVDSQGAAQLYGVTQRHEFEFGFGAGYNLAPGVSVSAEYLYEHRHQGDYNFATAAIGPTRDAQSNSVLVGTILTW